MRVGAGDDDLGAAAVLDGLDLSLTDQAVQVRPGDVVAGAGLGETYSRIGVGMAVLGWCWGQQLCTGPPIVDAHGKYGVPHLP